MGYSIQNMTVDLFQVFCIRETLERRGVWRHSYVVTWQLRLRRAACANSSSSSSVRYPASVSPAGFCPCCVSFSSCTRPGLDPKTYWDPLLLPGLSSERWDRVRTPFNQNAELRPMIVQVKLQTRLSNHDMSWCLCLIYFRNIVVFLRNTAYN